MPTHEHHKNTTAANNRREVAILNNVQSMAACNKWSTATESSCNPDKI